MKQQKIGAKVESVQVRGDTKTEKDVAREGYIIMISYYHCTKDSALLLSFLLTKILFHFMK